MKKLGHTAKPTDKDNVKAKKVAKQVKVDSQFKMSSDCPKDRYSLFAGEKVQPSLQLPPALKKPRLLMKRRLLYLKMKCKLNKETPSPFCLRMKDIY